MGISGLLKFIKKHNLYTMTDIVEVASKGKIKIIVENNVFHKYIIRVIAKRMAEYYDNNFLLMSFNECDITSNVYGDFHKAFHEAGIELVWLFEGPKLNKFPDNSSSVTTQQICNAPLNKTVTHTTKKSDDSKWIRGQKPGNKEPAGFNQRSNTNKNTKESWRKPSPETSEIKSEEVKDHFLQLSETRYPQNDLISWNKIINSRKKNKLQLFKYFEELRAIPLENTQLFLDFTAARQELKAAGAEVIQLSSGSSNDDVFKIYKEKNAYAILTNNTDFIIFENCNVIFSQLLDYSDCDKFLSLPSENDPHQRIFKTPTSFLYPIACSDPVIQKFELNNLDQLVVVAVLLRKHGDETVDIKLMNTKKFKYWSYSQRLEDTVKFVRQNEITTRNFLENPEVKGFLEMNPDNLEFLKTNLDYYTLNCDVNKSKMLNAFYKSDDNGDSLTSFLEEGFINGKINRNCIDINNGRYLRYMCFENSPGVFSSEDILCDLRAKMYPYLLDKSHTKVIEWDPNSGQFIDINVIHEEIQANKIKGDPDGMNIFKRLLSCRDTNLYETSDLENTIILHMLRYFYQINKDVNLRLSIVEMKALFVTVFYHYATSTQRSFSTQINRHFFREMKICPSGRCVTINSWFLNVYKTAMSFCGAALNIRDQIPLRKEVMNSSTLFAFYETVMGDTKRIGHLSTEIRTKLQRIEMEILTMFDREYNFITEE